MRGGRRDGAGRKPVKIDLLELEQLCVYHCTDKEIAGFFHCSVRTIEKRRKSAAFREVMERGNAKGCISLRRSQFKLAEKNAALAQWLGKQLLNQRDVRPNGPEENGETTSKTRDGLREEIDELLEIAKEHEGSE